MLLRRSSIYSSIIDKLLHGSMRYGPHYRRSGACRNRGTGRRFGRHGNHDVSSLEDWANARLLNRTIRRLSLTEAGKSRLPFCEQMLAV